MPRKQMDYKYTLKKNEKSGCLWDDYIRAPGMVCFLYIYSCVLIVWVCAVHVYNTHFGVSDGKLSEEGDMAIKKVLICSIWHYKKYRI